MLAEGVILLVHGLRLALQPLPFYADASTCLIAGTGILICSKKLGGDDSEKGFLTMDGRISFFERLRIVGVVGRVAPRATLKPRGRYATFAARATRPTSVRFKKC
jgi:hypothetical protein